MSSNDKDRSIIYALADDGRKPTNESAKESHAKDDVVLSDIVELLLRNP